MVHDFNAAIKSTVFWMCFFNLNILYVSQKNPLDWDNKRQNYFLIELGEYEITRYFKVFNF